MDRTILAATTTVPSVERRTDSKFGHHGRRRNERSRTMLKILFAAAFAAGIATASAQTPAPQPASVQLKALLDDDLAAVFRHSPWQATVRGVPGYDHLLPDLSFATLEKERARERDALEQLKAIDEIGRASCREGVQRRVVAQVSKMN